MLSRFLKALLLLLICIFVFAFALRNATLASIHLVFMQVADIPLSFLILGAFMSGALIGMLSALMLFYKLRKHYQRALGHVGRSL